MDAQHEKHRNFLDAVECDVVACPNLQFYLRCSIWKYNPKRPPSFPLHASQLAERQGNGTANDLAADGNLLPAAEEGARGVPGR